MNKISNLFSKNTRNLHFALIVLILIILFVGSSFVNPYLNQAIAFVFYSPFSKVNNMYSELVSVSEDNKLLTQSLIDASLKISMFEESERENTRLREVLGFEPPANYTLVPAEIISISGDYIPLSATINLGINDSVFVDQPVINQQGLIGRISSVSDNFSVVQLLSDPSNRVAARDAQTREMGIIKYQSKSGMILDNYPIQGDVKIGDEIISSGLGGVYPAGLKVGKVLEVITYELEAFYHIKVEPAANFYSLEELFILKENNTE